MKLVAILTAMLVGCSMLLYTDAQECPVTETEKVQGAGLCSSRGELNATKCQEHCKKYGPEVIGAQCIAHDDDCRPSCICKLKCHNANCWGDPHCTSFDGIKFDYQGVKKYYLVKPCEKFTSLPNFELRQSNRPWFNGPASVIEALELVIPEWERILEIKVPSAANPTFSLTTNGKKREIPYQYPSPDDDECSPDFIKVAYKDPAKTQVLLTTSFGLRVTLTVHPNANPAAIYSDLSVDVPRHPELKQKLCGLLGRPNDNKDDDFIDANGEKRVPEDGYGPKNWAFGDSWIVPGNGAWAAQCFRDDEDKKLEEHDKDVDPEVKKRAEELCKSNLENPKLLDCAKKLGRSPPLVEKCVFDLTFIKDETAQKELVQALVKTFSTSCDEKIPFQGGEECCPKTLVPLFRTYNPGFATHYYTPSHYYATYWSSAIHGDYRYIQEGSPGLVSTTPTVCQCQLKRIISMMLSPQNGKGIFRHFYTGDPAEAAAFAKKSPPYVEYSKFVPDHRDWYCSATSQCGATIPLRRYSYGTNHLLSANPKEGAAIVANGGKDEGIVCYVWPNPGPADFTKMFLHGVKGGDYS